MFGFSGSRFFSTDPPTSIVRLGSSLNASNIKEGDDVYFECQVQSNPPPNRIIWKKDVRSGLIFDSFPWNRYDLNLCFIFQIRHFLLKPLYPFYYFWLKQPIIVLISGQRGSVQPIRGYHPKQPQSGLAEGFETIGRSLHLSGRQ